MNKRKLDVTKRWKSENTLESHVLPLFVSCCVLDCWLFFFSSFKARTVRYRCKLKRPLAASVTKHALCTLNIVFIYSRWSRSKSKCQFFHEHDIPTVIRIRLSFVWMCVDANESKKKRAKKQKQQQPNENY